MAGKVKGNDSHLSNGIQELGIHRHFQGSRFRSWEGSHRPERKDIPRHSVGGIQPTLVMLLIPWLSHHYPTDIYQRPQRAFIDPVFNPREICQLSTIGLYERADGDGEGLLFFESHAISCD